MVDAGLVGDGERRGCLGGDLGSTARQQRPFGAADIPQGATGDQLHHHVVGAGVLAEVEDRDDVGVAQVGGSHCFAAEACDKGFIPDELRVENLDRDRTAQQLIFSLEHVRHSPTGKVSGEAVAIREDARFIHGRGWYRRPGVWWVDIGHGRSLVLLADNGAACCAHVRQNPRVERSGVVLWFPGGQVVLAAGRWPR